MRDGSHLPGGMGRILYRCMGLRLLTLIRGVAPMCRVVFAAVLALMLGSLAVQADADDSSRAQELRISWHADVVTAPEAEGRVRSPELLQGHRFSVLGRRRGLAAMPRERRPQLASDRIVIMAVDAAGQERSRTILPDPRIVRAERPGPDGVLTGMVLFRQEADFLLTLPDGDEVRELRIYQPRWTGEAFALDAIGTVPVE